MDRLAGIVREGLKSEETKLVKDTLKEEKCYPVFMGRKDIDRYYNGFCNRTIWPLFHYFPTYVKYDNEYWETYKKSTEYFSIPLRKSFSQMIWSGFMIIN